MKNLSILTPILASYLATLVPAQSPGTIKAAKALFADSANADLPFMADVERLYAETESTYGPTSAHLLAAQLLERRNGTVLHELSDPGEETP